MNWIKINDKEEISEQTHNNKTYEEIIKSLKKGERIATYEELQKFRNEELDERFKDFFVLVPNPDKISEKNGRVARFYASSVYADLGCYRYPSVKSSSLGVFLIRKIKKKKICSKCKQEIIE